MPYNYVSLRNIKFLLHEVLQAGKLNRFDYFADYDPEAINMALEAALQIGDTYLYPIYREMDKNKAYYKDGEVHVHPGLRTAIKAIADGGWITAPYDYESGGQQMPYTLMNAGLFTFYAANANAACHAFLTQGAARLIRNFAGEDLKNRYLPNMYSGDWQGTMAMTEPQAGSSLTDLTTSAELTEGGYYQIKGQKIYISGGDHTAVDNVVHLLLARIKGAPQGIKGISLFVVPKLRPEDGKLVSNDVTTAGIYGKMGQKGYVAAHLMLGEKDDCRGYLVGEQNQGLSYMFQMMNEARIGTGLVAAGTASAAYYASLKYANERAQGRHPSQKDPTLPQTLIIEHADVRRMLLFQKAIAEGSAALLLQCSYYCDVSIVAEGDEKEQAYLLFELLTPIAKSYPAEMGIQSVSAGMQCLGGAGYCDDFPLEQHYRDIRVNAIYEGTTGIHGMDLLGRKVMMANGKSLTLFMKEIKSEITKADDIESLKPYAAKMATSASELHELTIFLLELAMKDRPEVFLADASLYLESFGTVTIAWMWLKQAIVAEKALGQAGLSDEEIHFYRGKMATFQYFFEYELPKTRALNERLRSNTRITLDLESEWLV
ncbi:MAG: acyl-CoA dehydrogenase [Saprospiraceae bacterium]|nr:acyl-CoA dehydrogenase [Saprospiraceae bacterium]